MFIEIPEYPGYFMRETGEIYSTKSNKFLTMFKNTSGYPCYKLQKNGQQKNILVHRMLAFLFKELPSLDSTLEVDHKDRIKDNFSLSNLQVLTKQEHLVKSLQDKGYNTASVCLVCSTKIRSGTKYCIKHSPAKQIKVPEITEEDIRYWVSNFSWVRASKELGLSDNGLRKRFTKLTGLDPRDAKLRK